MTLGERFDRWVASGPFTVIDLARFRIVFGVGALLTLFDFSWFSGLPSTMYLPPPGPFMLFAGFPPAPIAITLEILVALAFMSIAIGYRTVAAGWIATVLMIIGFGFTYSLGKIDHPILFALAPAVLGHTGWGGALSLDAARGRAAPFRQWPLRLLALMIGIGFATAGFAKLRGGWLSFETQAVRREFLNFFADGNTGGILPWLASQPPSPLWEIADWATVLLELGLIVTVVSWRAFRIGIAFVTLFHLGVYVLLTISFGFNVLVYGAFVEWRRVPLPPTPRLAALGRRRWAPLIIPAVAIPVWAVSHAIPHTAQQSGPIILVGSGIAAGYLIAQLIDLARLARRRRAQREATSSAATSSAI